MSEHLECILVYLFKQAFPQKRQSQFDIENVSRKESRKKQSDGSPKASNRVRRT